MTLQAFREWMDNFQCCPKTLVPDGAFQHPDFQEFYRYHGIKPIATGPRTLWPKRAEKAVRLFKRQLALMTKYLAEEPSLPNRTFKNLVQKCCRARNNQLTIGGKTPLGLAFGRPPKPIHDLQLENPAQPPEDPPKEDATALTLQRLALRAHQEARQLQDLRKDIARNLRSSDGPFVPGALLFDWGHDARKIESGLGQSKSHQTAGLNGPGRNTTLSGQGKPVKGPT